MLQRRVDDHGNTRLDVQQQFLTTCMLPHLAELYDSRRVLFFFATNHKKTFDDAITRAGRFDMLLFVGPPTWKTKAENIGEFASFTTKNKKEIAKTSEILLKWIPETDALAVPLTRATFAEAKGMFREICGDKTLDSRIADNSVTEKEFRRVVEKWRDNEFSLVKLGALQEQYDEEFDASEVRW
jgi:SpoVK/Ycf46/Vps4 family AAA+-type ATPase